MVLLVLTPVTLGPGLAEREASGSSSSRVSEEPVAEQKNRPDAVSAEKVERNALPHRLGGLWGGAI